MAEDIIVTTLSGVVAEIEKLRTAGVKLPTSTGGDWGGRYPREFGRAGWQKESCHRVWLGWASNDAPRIEGRFNPPLPRGEVVAAIEAAGVWFSDTPQEVVDRFNKK